MTVTPQPTQETYYYKEVRRTQPGPGVVYPGYPIFHLYKRNLADNNPDTRETSTNKTETITNVSRVTSPSQIATITVGSNHQFRVGDMVTVSGLTNTSYNGTHVLTAVGLTTISYANAGAIQSSTADSGTATINIEYWLPLPNLTSYKEYTPGDENVPAQRTRYEPRTEIGVRRARRHYTDKFSVYTHKYSGTKLFVATNRTKLYPLSETRSMPTNPYSYRNIQVWIESPQTYTNTYDSRGNLIVPSYWYHPFENRFYTFGNLETFGFTDSQFLIDSLFTRDTSGQSNESLLANAAESIKLAKIDELISRGNTRAEAIALVNANTGAALTTRAANSLIMPSARIARQAPRGPNRTVNVTRASLGRTVTASSATIPASQAPKLVQTTTAGQTPLTYEFRHRPNQISYTSIGSEWSPIDRAANRPMIDWKSYKLMSVSFSFIVAPNVDGSLDAALDNNAITTSVDNDLKTLRQMASSPFPIVFMGFDKLLSEPAKYPFNKDSGNSSLFVISDFSVSSIYRSSTGAISRASCDITLTEYPKELIKLIEFPKLIPIVELPPRTPREGATCSRTKPSTTLAAREGFSGAAGVDFLTRAAARGFIEFNASCNSIVVVTGREAAWVTAKLNYAYDPNIDLNKIYDNGLTAP